MKRYVLTGGPGVGKSTMIDLLAMRGFVVLPEVARRLLVEYSELDLGRFQHLVAQERLVAEEMVKTEPQIFLDRGLVDGLVYSRLGQVEPSELVLRHGRGRYEKIFLLEPLADYIVDEVRQESVVQAQAIHEALADAYQEFGYQLERVPPLAPSARLEFILDAL